MLNDSQKPSLEQAFAVVMHWLDFDAPLNVVDAISLKSAFDEAATNKQMIFVAANNKNVVVMHDEKVFSMKVPQGSELWYRELAEEKEGLIADRDDLFLGNFISEEDEDMDQGSGVILAVLYDTALPDRKMTLS